MDDAEAVGAVCQLGREIEEAMQTAEAEAELRRWRPIPGGGHDPELRALWQAELARNELLDVLPGDKPGNGANTGGAERK